MPSEPPPRAVRGELDRVLASGTFSGSDRLSKFLRFSVESALSGAADDLKEYTIAVEVYGRKQSFDPKTDSIVRVEANRLRAKLKQYYQTEGSRDPVVIDIPKGRYAPVFESREAERDDRSIAVLPFQNMSADAENEYFSDGLTEELINALTRIDGLRVVARTSVFQFKGQSGDIRRIGAELNVRNVLEGSVRRSGDRLRVAAQLIDAANGFHIWSEVYEHQMKDVFAIQDDISRRVVNTLRVRLAGNAAAPAGPEHLEAYHLYLKGRHEWNKRTAGALWQAIEYFRQAIDLQPAYAAAYSGMADSYALLGVDSQAPPMEVLPQAMRAARQALELDENLAESHVSLALALGLHDYDWEGCERHLERAVELNPGSATAQYVYGAYLALRGRLDAALPAAVQAVLLDPVSVMINRFLAAMYLYRREYELAIDQCRKTILLDQGQAASYVFLGRMYLARNEPEFALATFQKARDLSSDHPFILGWIGHALARMGRCSDSREIFASVSESGALAPMLVHIGLGEVDGAFACLAQACDQRYSYIVNLQVDPLFDPLRTDPRFDAILDRMGLRRRAAHVARG
jgi:TolB-like protein/Tfp pilus assembly protein PilF